MKSILTGLVAVVMSTSGALASTINLSDNTFTDVTYQNFVQGPVGPIIGFEETVGGVTFNFTSISGQFRGVGTWGDGTTNTGGPFSANIGGGGGSVTSFTLLTSADVTLNGFWGLGQVFNTNPIFDVIGTGVSSIGNTFGSEGFLGSAIPTSNGFISGALLLTAGETYTFSVSNFGSATTGYLTGFDFSAAAPSPVPLPASLPLFAGGLGILGFLNLRRKRKAKTA